MFCLAQAQTLLEQTLRFPQMELQEERGITGLKNGQSRSVRVFTYTILDLKLYLEDISANLLLLGAHQKTLSLCQALFHLDMCKSIPLVLGHLQRAFPCRKQSGPCLQT